MKKAILLFAVFLTHSLFAQQNQPEPGTYISNTKTGDNVKLVIDDNNQFHITLLSGKLEQQNDSIYLRTQYDNQSLFQVEYVTSTTKPKTIKMDFGKNNYYSLYDIHLGIQKINDYSPEYKTLSDYLGIKEEAYEYSEDEDVNLSFEIEPVAFIYLANEDYNGTTIEKYEVPNGVSEIKVLKRNDLYGKLNLRGKYDTNTKEFTISEGRKPIVFVKEETKGTPTTFIRPLEAQQKKMWTYPGKEERYAAVDTAVVAYDYDNQKPPYIFKLKTEKSFNEALKVAQSSPDKILVVFYDTNKNASKAFEKFMQRYEIQVQSYMYDQYDPKLDRFNFYLATESDKSTLKKMGITEDESVIFINSDGTKIHHCKGSTKSYDYNYYKLSSYYKSLITINSKAQIDKIIADKKATVPQIEKVLLEVVNNERIYADWDDMPPPTVEPAAVEYEKYAVVTDSVAVADYSEKLPEIKNAYQLKSSSEALDLKYKQLLDFYLKEKKLNENILKIIVSELSYDNGFTAKLFNKSNQAAKPTDFRSMDYLFQFYNEIEALKTEDYYLENPQLVINAVSGILDRPSNDFQKEKIKEYYNKLLQASNQNPKVSRSIINSFLQSKNKTELISAYDNYFKSYVNQNSSLIEALDANYQLEKAADWDLYKAEFSNLANEVAWFIVENSQDKTEIQKAIQWSEVSLKLKVNDPYFLDTLAQLYYKNGEKEKGILFEQKAIEAAKIVDDTLIDTYEAVLEKMKNGTY
jgi:hypothetical protein